MALDKKAANAKVDRVLWIDLEMTGLDPERDPILEVAAIVTDWDFNEIATYEGIIQSDEMTLQDRVTANSIFWDQHPDSRDNLLKQNADGKDVLIVEDELIEFIDKNFTPGLPVLLAGNSIHMDRRFITARWPRLDARLNYRMLDVSAWKVVFENKYNQHFTKPEDHRALADIRGSITELQYYLTRVKV